MTGGKYWEANLAAVWGQMCTGGGHKPFAEAIAVLGVQTMSEQSFMSTERKIGEWWRDLFEESITFLCIFADNCCTTREEYKLHLHQTGVTFGFYCSLMASLLTTRMLSWIPCPMSIDKTATGSKANSLELESGEQFESNDRPSDDRSRHETSSFKAENQVRCTPAVGSWSRISKDLEEDPELNNFENTEHSNEESGSSQTEYHF